MAAIEHVRVQEQSRGERRRRLSATFGGGGKQGGSQEVTEIKGH
jgi:hypothetical protein